MRRHVVSREFSSDDKNSCVISLRRFLVIFSVFKTKISTYSTVLLFKKQLPCPIVLLYQTKPEGRRPEGNISHNKTRGQGYCCYYKTCSAIFRGLFATPNKTRGLFAMPNKTRLAILTNHCARNKCFVDLNNSSWKNLV